MNPFPLEHGACRPRLLTGILVSAAVLWASPGRCAENPPPCAAYICVAADSGAVVSELNADTSRAPASMVKMLEMLLVSEGMQAGSWNRDTVITATPKAQAVGGAGVRLRAGEKRTVEELMRAVAVLSANDAAMAVAEGLWGSEDAYLRCMNERARRLGMLHSEFVTVHGLPKADGARFDFTTARDLAILARHCVVDPQVMRWTGREKVVFRRGEDARRSTNRLLGRMAGCDGLKTGYTQDAGYCVTATAERKGIRLIAVVMGCTSRQARFDVAEKILEEGFGKVHRVRVLRRGQPMPPGVPVDNCAVASVSLAVREDLWLTLCRGDEAGLSYTVRAPERLAAPIRAGVVLGEVDVRLAEQRLGTAPLVTPHNLSVPSWRTKLTQSVLRRKPIPGESGG